MLILKNSGSSECVELQCFIGEKKRILHTNTEQDAKI